MVSRGLTFKRRGGKGGEIPGVGEEGLGRATGGTGGPEEEEEEVVEL